MREDIFRRKLVELLLDCRGKTVFDVADAIIDLYKQEKETPEDPAGLEKKVVRLKADDGNCYLFTAINGDLYRTLYNGTPFDGTRWERVASKGEWAYARDAVGNPVITYPENSSFSLFEE